MALTEKIKEIIGVLTESLNPVGEDTEYEELESKMKQLIIFKSSKYSIALPPHILIITDLAKQLTINTKDSKNITVFIV